MYTTDKECVMQDKDIVIYHLSPHQLPFFLLGFNDDNQPIVKSLAWHYHTEQRLDHKAIKLFQDGVRRQFGFDVEFLTIAAECKEQKAWGINCTGIRKKELNITEPYQFIGLFRNMP